MLHGRLTKIIFIAVAGLGILFESATREAGKDFWIGLKSIFVTTANRGFDVPAPEFKVVSAPTLPPIDTKNPPDIVVYRGQEHRRNKALDTPEAVAYDVYDIYDEYQTVVSTSTRSKKKAPR